MDIGKIFPPTLTDEGVEMQVLDPVNNRPILIPNDVAEKFLWIRLLGNDSDEVMRIRRTQINKRLEYVAKTGRAQTVSVEEQFDETTERLIAGTIGWNFQELDGKPFPCTPGNCRILYTDKRFSFIRNQAIDFMENAANFFKR